MLVRKQPSARFQEKGSESRKQTWSRPARKLASESRLMGAAQYIFATADSVFLNLASCYKLLSSRGPSAASCA